MAKKQAIALLIGSASLLFVACNTSSEMKEATNSIKLVSSADTLSYDIGYRFGQQLTKQIEKNDVLGNENPIDLDIVIKGFASALYNAPIVSERDLYEAQTKVINSLKQQKRSEDLKASVEKKNQLKASGYQEIEGKNGASILMKLTEEGKGDTIKSTDFVLVDCELKSAKDGKIFDSTIGKEPALMNPGNCFQGLSLAFSRLKKGSKANIYIPWVLAFGEAGMGPIPGSTDLEVKLDVKEVWHTQQEAIKCLEKTNKPQ